MTGDEVGRRAASSGDAGAAPCATGDEGGITNGAGAGDAHVTTSARENGRHGEHGTHGEQDAQVRRAELAISLVLRIGVTLSVAVIAAGLALMFIHHPDYATVSGRYSYHHLTSTSAPFPHTLSQLGAYLGEGRGRGLVVLGVLLLVATPVARVAVSVFMFGLAGDRPMTVVTLVVLAVLLVAFALGGGFG